MNTNRKSLFQFIVVPLLLLASVLTVAFPTRAAGIKAKVDDRAFHDGMRQLWEDHITWTRLVIVSIANDLPDTDATVGRLLQNQQDIGDAVKPFYGDAAGEQLSALLTDHILIAAEILQAAKAGDDAALNDAIERWYANAYRDDNLFLPVTRRLVQHDDLAARFDPEYEPGDGIVDLLYNANPLEAGRRRITRLLSIHAANLEQVRRIDR